MQGMKQGRNWKKKKKKKLEKKKGIKEKQGKTKEQKNTRKIKWKRDFKKWKFAEINIKTFIIMAYLTTVCASVGEMFHFEDFQHRLSGQ